MTRQLESFGFATFVAAVCAAALLIIAVPARAVPIGGNLLMHFDASNVTTDGGGGVTTWHNMGSAGSTLDALAVVTPPQLVAGALNNLPVVRFTTGPTGATNNTLRTGPLGADVPQPLTIIHVGLVRPDFNGGLSQQPFYYDGRVTPKRAAFFHSSGTTTSLHAGQTASGGTVPINSYNSWTAVFNGTQSFLNQNGAPRFGPSNVGTQPIDGLSIGNAQGTQMNRLDGDIAELLVYNRLINAAELAILSNHFSAKYDLPVANNLYDGKTSANGDYDFDVFGIGNSNAVTGFAAGSVTSGSDGKGLSIAALSGLDPGDFVLAGSTSGPGGLTGDDVSGMLRWQRDWYIDQTGSVDVSLVFDAVEAGVGPLSQSPNSIVSLLYRDSPTGTFTSLALTGVIVGDTITFQVPSALLLDGFYTIGQVIIPEPSTLMLLCCGAVGLPLASRRRKRSRGVAERTA